MVDNIRNRAMVKKTYRYTSKHKETHMINQIKPQEALMVSQYKALFIAIIAMTSIFSSTRAASELKVGDIAPNFTLLDESGQSCTLSDYLGQDIALVFYPKDFSPFCTRQMEHMRDDFALLERQGITVLAISADIPQKHREFKTKYNLPFKFLTATDITLNDYVVAGWIMPSRKTFLINNEGFVIHIIDHVKLKSHARQILDGFGK
jgi:thioredoxin-dependent peroxiredoxin